jgi:hypothetical protein
MRHGAFGLVRVIRITARTGRDPHWREEPRYRIGFESVTRHRGGADQVEPRQWVEYALKGARGVQMEGADDTTRSVPAI